MTAENHPVPITAGAAKALIQGSFKTLADVAQFNPKAYVKRSIFNTASLQFGLYCLEPGQVNPLHKHPHSRRFVILFKEPERSSSEKPRQLCNPESVFTILKRFSMN